MITIVGAGMAGLLASNMLRHRPATVIESQSALPNNHSAVLRFRTQLVSDVLGIPFKKVQLIKHVVPWLNPVADALAYSLKNTGTMRSDRSIVDGGEVVERYIAPDDLIKQMGHPERVHKINYNVKFEDYMGPGNGPIISTIPMPALMDIIAYPNKPEFNFVEGTNIICRIAFCDAYVSLYIPDPMYPFSRISITGDKMIIEIPSDIISNSVVGSYEHYWKAAAKFLGIPTGNITHISSVQQHYSKIQPIDDKLRKDFMYWATTKHNIYSLGRFATWRPGLLLDDLVKDIRLIDSWIQGNSYDRARTHR